MEEKCKGKQNPQGVHQKRSFLYNRWVERMRYYAFALPRKSFPLRMAYFAVGYVTLYNVVMRLIYGNDHPINRFTYRRWKAAGKLSPELLRKEELFTDYLKDNASRVKWFAKRDSMDISRMHPRNFGG